MGERECPICVDYLKPGEKIVQLACHELHKMHESCFRNLLDTNARMNQPQLNRCPFCMKPIVESEVKKMVWKQKEDPSSMKVEDAFGLPDPEPQDEAAQVGKLVRPEQPGADVPVAVAPDAQGVELAQVSQPSVNVDAPPPPLDAPENAAD